MKILHRLFFCGLIGFVLLLAGCGGLGDATAVVWGHKGVVDGDFVRPRAIAIDSKDRIYIVDFTARIQAYDANGQYLGITWRTPDFRNGRPSGLSIDLDDNLIVSDSHYHCARVYSPQGKELKVIGGASGPVPGQFGYVSDTVQDSDGNYFLSEFGANERITKLDKDGKLIKCWGCQGTGPGQFNHIRAIAIGPDGLLYVADACNHRIQVFDRDGKFRFMWGEPGKEPGQLSYPYDVAFGPNGELYVAENDNHRVQKFVRNQNSSSWESLGCWGAPGRGPGQLHNPWALAVDSRGRVHVVDTENHRIQRVQF